MTRDELVSLERELANINGVAQKGWAAAILEDYTPDEADRAEAEGLIRWALGDFERRIQAGTLTPTEPLTDWMNRARKVTERDATDLIVTTFGPQHPAEPTPKMVDAPATCDRCGVVFFAATTGTVMEDCPQCPKGRLVSVAGHAPACPHHPDTKMTLVDGTQPEHDQKTPHWRCELWVGSGVCGFKIPLSYTVVTRKVSR